VRSTDGDPAGYICFYSWKGQAYSVEGGSIVPDVSVLVSDPSLWGMEVQICSSHEIEFQAARLNPQSNWIQAGLLEYPGSDFNECVFCARSPSDSGIPDNYATHGMIGGA
jgi:hypothetical protein